MSMAVTGFQEKDNLLLMRSSPNIGTGPHQMYIANTSFSGFLLILLVTSLASIFFLACNSPNYDVQLKQARSYFLEGHHAQSKQILNELIKSDVDATEAFLLRGIINENNSE